ncbi:MAG: hypothetical protein P4L61_02145 [Candidatus Pacebacteria bacterium]|nr:hypothetical protein [Candidatus Paceibacterota bacterium]
MENKPKTVTQTSLKDEDKLSLQMPSTKISAFLKEFPWVENYTPQAVRSVYVSRISPEIIGRSLESITLKVKVGTEYDIGVVFDIYRDIQHNESLYLIDEKGDQVYNYETSFHLIRAIPAHRKYRFFGPIVPAVPAREEKEERKIDGEVHYGTTLGKKLAELGERADSVKFVLSYWDQTGALIVYKVPNGVTLPVWINLQIEAEQAAFKHQCQDIDAEASAV